MKKLSISVEEGPQVIPAVKNILAQTKEATRELRDHKEAKRIVRKTAKQVAKEVKESNYPSALEGVKVTRRLKDKQKARKADAA